MTASVRTHGESVTVQLVGRARLIAGRSELRTSSGSLREVLASLPAELEVCRGDEVARPYLVSLDGRDFVRDARIAIEPGQRVVVLDASAGG